jgi:hypothetical protein
MKFSVAIAEPERIHHQLDRLAARVRGRRLDALVQDGVRFSELLDERERVVRLLARALGDSSFRPGVARVGRVQLGGKPREVGQVGALELLAHAVVADVLAEAIEPTLSPHLWSYRKGRSSWQALRAIARMVRAHRRARPDPRTRGLYVLRSDVRAYTDEIPVDEDAKLWRDLDRAGDLDAASSAMVRALVRPEVASGDDAPARRARGVLFGLPTTTVIANLYLAPLDAALSALGGTYARFGDDVLFASEDPDRVREARSTLERILFELGLEPHRKKLRVLYWNGAARPSPVWPEADPTDQVVFLGGAIQWSGTIALTPEKWTLLLRELRTRIRRTAALAGGESEAARASLLASIANEGFDVRSLLSLSQAQLVADLVSDRAQLRQLDYLIALAIAEAVTGKRGPRAFRALPPKALRAVGLESRVAARNRGCA